MPNQKISNLTPKGSALVATDLLEVSVFNGTTYDTRSVTGANVVSGLQPTLVSGTNIKTINSTSLLGSGDIAISTGLTVGTTAIASGTVGRVLFEGTGNVVQEDAKLFWDNTNKKLGIGATPDVNTVLDVRSAGILATDLAFRVRNSANTLNAFKIQGDNEVNVRANLSLGNYAAGVTRKLYMVRDAETFGLDLDWAGANTYGARIVNNGSGTVTGLLVSALNGTRNDAIYATSGDVTVAAGKVVIGTHTATAKLDVKAGGALSTDIALRVRNSADSANLFQVNGDGSGGFNIDTKVIKFGSGSYIQTGSNNTNTIFVGFGLYNCALTNDFDGNNKIASNFNHLNIGGSLSTDGTKTLEIANGTAPTSTGADSIKIYADQISGYGTSAPHFRTADGNIIKLYKQTTAVAAAAFVANTSLIANDTATFDGYTMGQVVKALRNAGLLA
jgi:hypothetical protein